MFLIPAPPAGTTPRRTAPRPSSPSATRGATASWGRGRGRRISTCARTSRSGIARAWSSGSRPSTSSTIPTSVYPTTTSTMASRPGPSPTRRSRNGRYRSARGSGSKQLRHGAQKPSARTTRPRPSERPAARTRACRSGAGRGVPPPRPGRAGTSPCRCRRLGG